MLIQQFLVSLYFTRPYNFRNPSGPNGCPNPDWCNINSLFQPIIVKSPAKEEWQFNGYAGSETILSRIYTLPYHSSSSSDMFLTTRPKSWSQLYHI